MRCRLLNLLCVLLLTFTLSACSGTPSSRALLRTRVRMQIRVVTGDKDQVRNL